MQSSEEKDFWLLRKFILSDLQFLQVSVNKVSYSTVLIYREKNIWNEQIHQDSKQANKNNLKNKEVLLPS